MLVDIDKTFFLFEKLIILMVNENNKFKLFGFTITNWVGNFNINNNN